MLILTRKVRESLTIKTGQGNITVTVMKITGRERASLGIDAPASYQVLRSELDGVNGDAGDGN